MDYVILFVFGAIIGSFLNVCIFRIPRNISLIRPGSFCPNCGSHIPIYYNIPVVSYVALKGRCHYCYQPIPLRYFIVEVLTGLLTVATYWKFGLTPAFFFYVVLIYFLIVISFIDLATQLIYNKLLVYLMGFGVIFNLLYGVRPWQDALIGFLAGGVAMFSFAVLGRMLFHKESMGMGDVKFAAVLGFFLGWKMVLLALFFGYLYAMLAFLFLAISGKARMQDYLPMAPFFTFGSLTFVYWGPKILQWYWNYFVPGLN